ncbi:MAG: ATP phosphoribosyltransferase [Anaerolineae bacterium]
MATKLRLGLPSKGRLQQDTLDLLQACGMKVSQRNPRQYIAQIDSMPHVEVWFQRPADIVRQVRNGDVELGIAGFDAVAEYRGRAGDVVIVHNALGFGHCTLEVVVPERWADVNAIADLAALAHSAPADHPLRVVSKFERLTTQFLNRHDVTPHRHLHADGALEAAPNMNTADFIVDLVQTGLTLQENRLKRIEGGQILHSQACFIGNGTALKRKPDTLAVTRQMLELFEAHLRAEQHYNVIANVRGPSAEAVAQKLHRQSDLGGLQGPTISPVYPAVPAQHGWYAISLIVHKAHLQTAIQQLRAVGGSGVVVLPATFIFEEEPEQWRLLRRTLGM